MAIIDLATENFQAEITKADKPVLVDFWAVWCGPCQMMAPILHELETEMPDVQVGKVNVDEQMDLARQFRVVSIPTLIIFKNGQEVQRMVGVTSKEELKDALKKAAQYDEKVLVEEFISGHEVEVAVLGNKNPIASVVGEVIAGAEFYDYDAKYNSPQSRTEIPADISEDAAERLRKAAVTVYEAMGCKGLSRVDFFLTYEGEEVVFNEINTIPGFTSISMYPKLFEAAGVPNQKLIEELISLAMEA